MVMVPTKVWRMNTPLYRLSKRGSLLHIPAMECEVPSFVAVKCWEHTVMILVDSAQETSRALGWKTTIEKQLRR